MRARLEPKPEPAAHGGAEHRRDIKKDPPVAQRAAAPPQGIGAPPLPVGETIADYAGSYASGLARTATAPNRTGLPDGLKNGIEALSGVAMDDVRVHRNSARPAQLQALAHAQGSEIHLGPGQDHHLAHEAWHVVQQKQGRVRPTMQLGSTAINDEAGLEQEADRMGERAAAMPPTSGAAAAAALPPPRDAPLQAVWIIRNDQMVWENDPYVLQPGERYPFPFRPHVLVDQGTQEVRFDTSGTQSVVKRKPPPTHEDLQKTREAQGLALRGRLLADPGKIKGLTQELSDLAGKLEGIVGRFAPLKNAQKSQNLIKGGEVLGEKFRTMVKAKDEFTQSEATAAHIKGLRTDDKSAQSGDVEAYAAALLRLMSSLRTPTATVLAPVTHNSKVIGQQHPTSHDQPVLEQGASGHSFADRDRVQTQVDTFRQAIGDSSAGPNHIALASILSALSKTLASMSAPTSASNLPRFHSSRAEQQVKERELIKQQLNLIAQTLKIPVESARQDFDDPWRETDRPTSPIRNESTAPKIKKPPPLPSPLATTSTGVQTQTPSTTTPKTPSQGTPQTLLSSPDPSHMPTQWLDQLLATTDLQEDVTVVADRLLLLLQHQGNAGDVPRAHYGQDVMLVRQAAAGIDVLDPASLPMLRMMLNLLNQAYREAAPILTRRSIGHVGPEDPLDAGGQRLAALEQVFAECGQMAAHNALAIVGQPDLTAPDVQAGVQNHGALNALGNFHNNIDENAIRQMLAAAQVTDIPVFGNIDQVGAIVDHLHQNDLHWLADRQIGQGEANSLQPVLAFMRGLIPSLTLILNTQGHEEIATRQLHWITVRVTRTDTGLAVQYLDSLYAPANYTAVFAGLRQLLARAPRQAQPQVHLPAPPFGGLGGSPGLTSPSFGSPLPLPPAPSIPSTLPFFPPSHGASDIPPPSHGDDGWSFGDIPFFGGGLTDDWLSAPLPSLFPELDNDPLNNWGDNTDLHRRKKPRID